MANIQVQVTDEHLAKVSRTKPSEALLELIWNSLDGDATLVAISFETGIDGNGITAIKIADNGTGIAPEDAQLFFGRLGHSWKKLALVSKGLRRALHGKEGEGRFKAFSLGAAISWQSVYEHDGKRVKFTIASNAGSMRNFEVSDPVETKEPRGTTVFIAAITESLNGLLTQDTADDIAESLAPYLLRYPNIIVRYNGRPLDVKNAVLKEHREYLPEINDLEGKPEQPELRIFEWRRRKTTKREIHFCDADGLSLYSLVPWFHTTGLEFSAYILSRRIRQLHDANRLPLYQLEKTLDDLLESAKKQIKQYHLTRKSEQARSHIDKLKQDGLYPYAGDAADNVEAARRQLFDVIALNIAEHNPKFDESDQLAKKLSYRLIRQAIDDNPESIQTIISSIINLPKETQDDLAELLQSTSLASIVHATKTVADRLKFLAGLDTILYDPDLKPHLKDAFTAPPTHRP